MRLHTYKKTITSVFLIFSLLLSSFSCMAESSYRWSVSDRYLNVYLRVFVNTNTRSSWVGHYDLRINGDLKINDKTFKDPCFSYGEGSIMYIFNAADTFRMYNSSNYNSCREYTMHFKIKDKSRFNDLLKYLSNQISSCTTSKKNSRALKCTFKSSSRFSKYKAATVNCFTAASIFLKKLGNSTLWSIYNNAYKTGKSYLPKPFVQQYSAKLKRLK